MHCLLGGEGKQEGRTFAFAFVMVTGNSKINILCILTML